jgi:hypothetical protein
MQIILFLAVFSVVPEWRACLSLCDLTETHKRASLLHSSSQATFFPGNQLTFLQLYTIPALLRRFLFALFYYIIHSAILYMSFYLIAVSLSYYISSRSLTFSYLRYILYKAL